MMNAKDFEELFSQYTAVKLVYLFGSRAEGSIGPMSDYDFAVYLDEKDPSKRFQLKLDILEILGKKLKTEAVDIVILNDAEQPELKYHIIREGKLIYEKEPFRVLIEPKILSEYFDFHESLQRYGLTKI